MCGLSISDIGGNRKEVVDVKEITKENLSKLRKKCTRKKKKVFEMLEILPLIEF